MGCGSVGIRVIVVGVGIGVGEASCVVTGILEAVGSSVGTAGRSGLVVQETIHRMANMIKPRGFMRRSIYKPWRVSYSPTKRPINREIKYIMIGRVMVVKNVRRVSVRHGHVEILSMI